MRRWLFSTDGSFGGNFELETSHRLTESQVRGTRLYTLPANPLDPSSLVKYIRHRGTVTAKMIIEIRSICQRILYITLHYNNMLFL